MKEVIVSCLAYTAIIVMGGMLKNLKRIGKISFSDQRPKDYWAEQGTIIIRVYSIYNYFQTHWYKLRYLQ